MINRVESIDQENSRVKLRNSELRYDYLIVRLGAESVENAIPCLKDSNINLWILEGALRLREELGDGAKRMLIGPFRMPYQCLSAPIELVGLIVKSPLYQGEIPRHNARRFSSCIAYA